MSQLEVEEAKLEVEKEKKAFLKASNKIEQMSKMLELLEPAVNSITKTEEEESNVGLIVHTKHSCDKCFKDPIIGKRYKSDVKANFDLCASCFNAYTGPDIGLSEEVLSELLC